MPKHAIYLRKSRADIEAEAHGEGETLQRHENMLIELAKKMNLSISAIYREVVSGDSIDARPQVQRLLNEVESGLYDGVFVVDIDRLARGDTVDQGIIARTFRLSNTKIITPKKIYDPENEFDEEYFEFELFMARREYKIISRRIQRGRIASVNDGKYIGSTPPYGYDKVKIIKGKGYTLEPNGEADTVKMIFDMYLQGQGMTIIANTLDDMHIKPRRRDTWTKSTIRDILRNPVYTGKIRWSYRPDIKTSVNGKVEKQRVINDNCILTDGIHEAIISTEDFEKAQSLMATNRKAPVKQSAVLQNPFTGLIYCGLCGFKMTRLGENSRNKYAVIKCTNKKCRCVSAPIFLVEDELMKSLRQWLIRYQIELKTGEESKPSASESIKLKEKAISEMQDELKKIDVQISNTYDLLEQNVYTIDIFTERNKILSERKQNIISNITKIKQSLAKIESAKTISGQIVPAVLHIMTSYNDFATAEEKNDMLKSVLQKIIYKKETPNRKGQLYNTNFELDLILAIPDDYQES